MKTILLNPYVPCSLIMLASVACSSAGPSDGASEGTPSAAESTQPSIASAAQIAELNASADESAHLLARVYVNDGLEMGEFYEPAPGTVLFSAAGVPNGHAQIDRTMANLDPIAIYQRLSPRTPIPAPLQEAWDRAQVATTHTSGAVVSIGGAERAVATGATEHSPSNPTQTSNGLGVVSEALTSGYCGTQWLTDFPCEWGWGHTSYSWCWYDQWGNGDSTWMNNGNKAYYNVCPEVNSVILHIWGTMGGSWTVWQNTYRWQSYSSNWPSTFSQQSAIEQAGSSEFNYEGYLNW